ncbi:hypothetical protein HMPREF3220_00435 [Citrobacter koseri]|nr:hypothetical protein HMPREF3220_00435 [Citrobacter koseri]
MRSDESIISSHFIVIPLQRPGSILHRSQITYCDRRAIYHTFFMVIEP